MLVVCQKVFMSKDFFSLLNFQGNMEKKKNLYFGLNQLRHP